MAGNRNILKFDTPADGGYNTVKKVIGVDLFLAAGIKDGEGKMSNRLLIRARGDSQFYFLFAKGVEEGMRPASEWLQKLMDQELGSSSGDELPDDPITGVPTGNPLED